MVKVVEVLDMVYVGEWRFQRAKIEISYDVEKLSRSLLYGMVLP